MKKLLVIDDEENMRHFLKTLLEKEGYTVSLAGNGAAGLELLEQQITCSLGVMWSDWSLGHARLHRRKRSRS